MVQQAVPCHNCLHGIVEVHTAAWRTLCRGCAEVVRYVGVKRGANSAMQYKCAATGFRCCLTRQFRATSALRYGTLQQLFPLRCNVGTERVAIHPDVAKVACAARRCDGKRVEVVYVAMDCIYASHRCIKVYSPWKCCGTFSMLQWLSCKD